MKKNLSKFIKDPDLEILELKMKEPNFFFLLKIQNQEIRHSNFLGWLIDPEESHGLGDTFLRMFLKDCFSSEKFSWIDEFEVDSLDLNDIEILREYRNIDLLINSKEFVLLIENKFYSKEHSNQLNRYQKILEKEFPEKRKGYIFLTIEGLEPEGIDEKCNYFPYSYENILDNLSSIMNIYERSLSNNVQIYIRDYLSVLRREVLMEDELNDIAERIYKSHKSAIDFIVKNIPDNREKYVEFFKTQLENEEMVIGTSTRVYARFLTQKLYPLVPRNADKGWANKEAFLFEFAFTPEKIYFRTVISPGDEELREKLCDALNEIAPNKNSTSKGWIIHFGKNWRYDLDNDIEDKERMNKKFDKVWKDVEKIVYEVETKFLDSVFT